MKKDTATQMDIHYGRIFNSYYEGSCASFVRVSILPKNKKARNVDLTTFQALILD